MDKNTMFLNASDFWSSNNNVEFRDLKFSRFALLDETEVEPWERNATVDCQLLLELSQRQIVFYHFLALIMSSVNQWVGWVINHVAMLLDAW